MAKTKNKTFLSLCAAAVLGANTLLAFNSNKDVTGQTPTKDQTQETYTQRLAEASQDIILTTVTAAPKANGLNVY